MTTEALSNTRNTSRAFDKLAKKLLSRKMILAWILHECVEGYQHISIQDIAENYIEENNHTEDYVEGISNEEEEVRYDLRFKARDPNNLMLREVIINVEIQNKYNPGYELSKRGIYYGCKMIAGQYGKEFKHSNYDNVKKVITIWLCMEPPVNRMNSMIRFGMEGKIEEGSYEIQKASYDLLEVIMIHVGKKVEKKGIYQLVEVLLVRNRDVEERKRILEEIYGIKVDEKMEKEMRDMSELGMFHYNMGKAEGRAEGREEGRIEGIAEGIKESLMNSIKNVMLSLQISIGNAMEILQIPKSERAYYEEKIKESEGE